jgi:DNA end-binding protein Ku
MRFPHELADLSDFRFPAESAGGGKDVAMAKRLIEELSDDWTPAKYKDDYEANLERLIRAKLKGREADLKEAGAAAPAANVVDLMERLKQSLAGSKAAKSPRKARGRRQVA